jgi:GTPase involved in cell partitioning and DNA repair
MVVMVVVIEVQRDGDDKFIEVPLGTVVKTKKQAKSCLKY